jgi:hypothetical protein
MRWLFRRPTPNLDVPEWVRPRDSALRTCFCGSTAVHPTDITWIDDERVLLMLRCGACDARSDVAVSRQELATFQQHLLADQATLLLTADELERQQLRDEAGRFIARLRNGQISAADFER